MVGLAKVLSPERLTVVVNTGDDEEFHGLHVSPDLDTVMYTLAGLSNPQTGWGLVGDSFQALEMLGRYGADAWFNLGDRDLGTHIRRTDLLRQGWPLSQVTQALCCGLGIQFSVAPMSDQRVRTIVETDEGPLPMQDYFVRLHCEPKALGTRFEGAESAVPSPALGEALEHAGGLVFCPSNPFLSVAPILAVPGVRERIASFRGPRVAVSPIVGGEALRGPAAKLLQELGLPVSSVGVAQQYQGLCDVFVLDQKDACLAEEVRSLGMEPQVTNTVMESDEDKERLARFVCELIAR